MRSARPGELRDEDDACRRARGRGGSRRPSPACGRRTRGPADTRCGGRSASGSPRSSSVSSAVAPAEPRARRRPSRPISSCGAGARAALARSPPRSSRRSARASFCAVRVDFVGLGHETAAGRASDEVIEDASPSDPTLVVVAVGRRAVPAAERSPPDRARAVDRCVAGS